MNLFMINALQPLVIGRQDDNLVTEIGFDCAVWSKKNPALINFRLEITSPKGVKYIPGEQRMDGSVLVWTVTNTDTAIAGEGEYEIIATGEGGEQQASAHAKLYISDRADGTPGVAPDYEKPLLDQMAEYAQRAEAAAEKAESTGGLPESNIPYQVLISDGAGNAYWDEGLAFDALGKEILPKSDVTPAFVGNHFTGFYAMGDEPLDIVEGERYVVIVNNYKLSFVAAPHNYNGTPCLALGAMTCPIVIIIPPPELAVETKAVAQVQVASGFLEVPKTLSIHLCATKKLDKRFLPEATSVILTAPGGERYQLAVDDSGNLTTAKI